MTATADLSKEPQDQAPRTAQLVMLGGDTREVPLASESRSVGSYLDEAEVTVSEDHSITLNGRAATRETMVEVDDPDRQVVITIAPQVSNG